MPTNVRDPRTLITPDAFEVSPDLLGLPLASPRRRLLALIVDVVVIGTLTAVTSDLSLFIWGAVALFLVSMAFRSPGHRLGQMTSVLFRGATGCLGFLILVGVGIGFLAISAGGDDDDDDDPGISVPGLAGGLGGLLRGLGDMERLHEADDTAEARQVLTGLLERVADVGVSGDELAEVAMAMAESVPGQADWRDDRILVAERALREVVGEAEGGRPEPDEGAGDREDVADAVAGLTDREAVEAWADLALAGEPGTAGASLRLALLRERVLGLVAADTLEALAEELEDARDEREDAVRRRQAVEAELEEQESGVIALLRDIWDQLGSAIGLWSVYFTVALTVTGGRTVGKKIAGIRVLRLDGEPITWWTAFERAGGYAAGIATGLMGFAQVFWDPNRQCVHDKIVGTAVVQDGVAAVPGAWQEAWAEQQEQQRERRGRGERRPEVP